MMFEKIKNADETLSANNNESNSDSQSSVNVQNQDASILQRTINKGKKTEYNLANAIGSRTGLFQHSLVDFDGLRSVDNVRQFSGKDAGIKTEDNYSAIKDYKIKYTGMDNELAKKAADNVLDTKRFGGSHYPDNLKNAGSKYKIFLNDCNDYTDAVFKEYERLWKNRYAGEYRTMNQAQVNKAWREHKKQLSARKGEKIEIK